MTQQEAMELLAHLSPTHVCWAAMTSNRAAAKTHVTANLTIVPPLSRQQKHYLAPGDSPPSAASNSVIQANDLAGKQAVATDYVRLSAGATTEHYSYPTSEYACVHSLLYVII